jgi:hypothetical protein
MRDLEVTTEGSLAALMQGHPIVIDLDSVRALSAWAVKTAMMRSFMDPGASPLDPDEMKAFARDGVPPRGWFVFLGLVDLPFTRSQHTKRGIGFGPGGIDSEESVQHMIHQTSFWLGSLFLTVVGQHGRNDLVDALSEDFIEITSAMTRGITRLWPEGEPTAWPGTELLTMSDSVAVHSWVASMFEE